MRRYYLDSSAIIKLFISEPESEPLLAFLNQAVKAGHEVPITSELSRVEVIGRLAQLGIDTVAANDFFENSILIPIKRSVIDLAITSRALGLKSLDAIHHATAVFLAQDIEAVICYDDKLSNALNRSGLKTFAPAI